MIDCNQAFEAGYADGMGIGENLNPYDPDSIEWEAYENGYLEYINQMLAEAAALDKEHGGLAYIDN